MTIEVTCDGCGEEFRIRDEAAGKTFKCKVCGKTLEVPFPDEELDELPDSDFPTKKAKKKSRSSSSEASSKTLIPAIGLYVIGGIWLAYGIFNLVFVMMNPAMANPPPNANEAA